MHSQRSQICVWFWLYGMWTENCPQICWLHYTRHTSCYILQLVLHVTYYVCGLWIFLVLNDWAHWLRCYNCRLSVTVNFQFKWDGEWENPLRGLSLATLINLHQLLWVEASCHQVCGGGSAVDLPLKADCSGGFLFVCLGLPAFVWSAPGVSATSWIIVKLVSHIFGMEPDVTESQLFLSPKWMHDIL